MLGKLQKYNKRCVPILYKHRILAAEKTLIWKQEGYAQCPEMKMSVKSSENRFFSMYLCTSALCVK